MSTPTPLLKEKYFVTGIIFLLISFGVYALFEFNSHSSNDSLGLFALHYIVTIVYFLILLTAGKFKKGRGGLPHVFVLLLLFLVSAYSLNNDMLVFDISVPWVCVAIGVYSINYLVLGFFEQLGKKLKNVACFILGSATIFFTYLAIYLLPLTPVSIMISFVLGISLHTIVPLLFVLFSVKQEVRIIRQKRSYGWVMLAGAAFSFLIPVVFAIEWRATDRIVERHFQNIGDDVDLPEWIKVAQFFPQNWVTEKYLKSGFVYSVPKDITNWDFGMPQKSFDEARKHDPLVMFALLCNKPPAIDEDDRMKILEVVYNSRHKTQERLWSGKNLSTNHVTSNIRIWPELHIAYTEKIITIANSGEKNFWSREEAIYTFHLPEGGLVSSLSLWIDGKEQKGILTSLKKADTAYHTIVGVEQHDPSMVKWQEGNTVTVRVFPVTPEKKRIFKIGITAPLEKSGDNLIYEPSWFEGPDADGADETVQLAWSAEPKDFTMPKGFTLNGDHRYLKEGRYDADWQLQFKDPGVSPSATFSFDGATYSIKPYTQQRAPMDLKAAYLDVNGSWTKSEFQDAVKMLRKYKIFAFTDQMIEVTEKNEGELFGQLEKKRFSLFPFYEVKDAATSLVVSKSPEYSPNLKDLDNSTFLERLKGQLAKNNTYRVFNIGHQLSPYLKSLKEHRVFDYESGDLALFGKLIAEKDFARCTEDDNHIVIDNAAITLVKDTGASANSAPDHLMRLFTYNHIMHELKNRLAASYADDTTLVPEAEKAYVITPVSSMIVLETQADYDRFHIKKSDDTIGDASQKAVGAVPEPHEWVLIIIAVVAGIWLLFGQKFTKTASRG